MKRLLAVVMLLVLCMIAWAVPAAAEDWTCAACSTANAGNFCTECGVPKPTPAPTPAPKKCLGCGFTAEADSPYKFCPICGVKFGEEPATPTPKPTATPKPTPSPTPKKTPTPTPKKTPTPTPQRVFKMTAAQALNNEGAVRFEWMDSTDRAPYKVTYMQHRSDDYHSDKHHFHWIATESTYLNQCTIDYLEPGTNYWITVEDRDGKQIRYEYKPQKFLNFESFDIKIQTQLKQRKTGDGVKVNKFSVTDIENKTRYEWGFYLKLSFPKRGSTKDYVMHVSITDPNGVLWGIHRHDCMTLQKGWSYVYWDFYDITDDFKSAMKYDKIVPGQWHIWIYLNNRYVGCSTFNVTK